MCQRNADMHQRLLGAQLNLDTIRRPAKFINFTKFMRPANNKAMDFSKIKNPYRPGAGSTPPHFAGRQAEQQNFRKLLEQDVIVDNLLLTGLRGVGKTALLEYFAPIAKQDGWLWVSNDLSESTSVTEETVAKRIITDLALITSGFEIPIAKKTTIGFLSTEETVYRVLDYNFLSQFYAKAPGLASDKLESLVDFVWPIINGHMRGIVFAYDEAQTMSDHQAENQFPLSLLLGFFQRIQRKGVRFLLVLTGLPTLMTRLVETRTYAERLFTRMIIGHLDETASREAVVMPVKKQMEDGLFEDEDGLIFSPESIDIIVRASGGYPYFIQFICKEAYDALVQSLQMGATVSVPLQAILSKLDDDFFSARWEMLTDRQKELLIVVATLPFESFSPKALVGAAQSSEFGNLSPSNASQLLSSLEEKGMIYKYGRGTYRLAVPMLKEYVLRIRQKWQSPLN